MPFKDVSMPSRHDAALDGGHLVLGHGSHVVKLILYNVAGEMSESEKLRLDIFSTRSGDVKINKQT